MKFLKIKDFFDNLEFKLTLKQLKSSEELVDVVFILNEEKIYARVKTDTRPQHIPIFESMLQDYNPFLVVSDYITPNAKKLLKNKGINYIDGFGNAFLNLNTLKLYVEQGNAKPIYNTHSDVFTQAGGQIIFQLLQNPENINLTQRKLAEISNVSLGSVSKIINGLFNEGFTVKWNSDKKYQLVKREELLDKWIILVNEKILPAHKIGQFSFSKQGHFMIRETDSNYETKWGRESGAALGGESGAAILTNYLNPEKYSLFTNRSKTDLIKNYRLIPDDNGEITAYQLFWQPGTSSFDFESNLTVHPLLIYAELMYSGNDRNIETAQIIYNEYIKPKL